MLPQNKLTSNEITGEIYIYIYIYIYRERERERERDRERPHSDVSYTETDSHCTTYPQDNMYSADTQRFTLPEKQ